MHRENRDDISIRIDEQIITVMSMIFVSLHYMSTPDSLRQEKSTE